jgi:uncharacterized protein DUF402
MLDRQKFASGDAVVIRTITGGKIRWAAPAIVVSDSDEEIAYYRPPGTTVKITGGAHVASSRRDRELALRSELIAGSWELLDHKPAGSGTLVVARFSDWFSVSLRPDPPTGDYRPTYINVETPHTRTALGFDVDDLCLDVVIDSDLQCNLKDEGDLIERAALGIYSSEQVEKIRDAASTAISRANSRQPPFDGSWALWRPDSRWRTPELPFGWRVTDGEL